MDIKKISVIVPACNSEKTIGQTIEAILLLDSPVEKEVIVIDDGSVDNTAGIIRSFVAVTYLHQGNAGPASARNHGAGRATGDILFFTDADCRPHRDWIARMMPYFSDPRIGAVTGSYGIANPDSLLARCVHQEIMYRHVHRMPDYPKVFGSYNLAIRRSVFQDIGGFDQSYVDPSGEDNDLSYRLIRGGQRIAFARDAFVDHYHPERLSRYLWEQFRHGFWRVKMYRAFPAMGRGDDYTFWKDILEVPWVLLLVILMILSVGKIPGVRAATGGLLLGLLILEWTWACRMARSGQEKICLGWVMFLRALTRTLGFVRGVLSTLGEAILAQGASGSKKSQ